MEKKLTYLVIDDDYLAHNVLTALNGKIDFIECIGSCYDSLTAMSMIMEKKPDFLFLDIEMPGMTGLDLLEVMDKSIKVIITSSFLKYAEDAYLYPNVVGYLKKPISPDVLCKTISNLLILYKTEKESALHPSHVRSAASVFVKKSGKGCKLNADDILICKSNSNYIDIESEDHQIFKYKGSLKMILNILPSCNFVRISKNTIIPIRKVRSRNDNNIELMDKSIYAIVPEYIEQFELFFNLKFAEN